VSIFDQLNYNNNYIAITDDSRQFKYADLENFSNKIKCFIKKRSIVFCLCKNNIETLFGYCSFIKNKVVPLMLEASINIDLLNSLINIYSPKFIWLPEELIVNFSDWEILYSIHGYVLVRNNSNNYYSIHNDLALLLTTSGSTGSAKLVRLSYENLKSNAISISKYLSIDKNERPITTLPISYSFGISIINSHLINGATILLTNKSLMERKFWSFLEQEKCTSLSGVPFTFEMLKKLRFYNMDLPSVTTITQAGGKMNIDLNSELAKFCKKNNKRLFIMYGQTEASPRMSYLPYQKAISKLGSVGIAIPGGEFNIIDHNDEVISESNVEGELVYKGNNVSLGYANCINDLSKGDENNGILYTGDIAKMDKEGFYYITGRKKRFIKLFGNRINLDEVEGLLKNIAKDCVCIGNDNQMIVYICDHSIIKKISNFLSLKLGLHNSVFSIRIIEEIPKNSFGKTIYSKLRM